MNKRVILTGILSCTIAVGSLLAMPQSQIMTAQTKGFVFYADGTTPAKRVPIRVWDIEKQEFIFETETNDYGYYEFPEIEPGDYYLALDWTRIRLTVDGVQQGMLQQPHHVIVVIPRDVAFLSHTHLYSILFISSLTEFVRQEEPPDERDFIISP